MPKVNTSQNKPTTPLLDTLAQLRKIENSNPLKAPLPKAYTANQSTLQKRSSAKAITNAFVFKLTPLQSPLNKAYWSTFHCSNAILQDGNKLAARYCNQRWCLVCNHHRPSLIRKIGDCCCTCSCWRCICSS